MVYPIHNTQCNVTYNSLYKRHNFDAYIEYGRYMVARHHGPHYDIKKLIRDCKKPGKVSVRKQAQDDAKLFGFPTQSHILAFLTRGELEDLEHQNTNDLNDGPDAGIIFDAYYFRVGPRYVYFAFYQRPNGLWIIKSFHEPKLNEKAPSLSHTPFAKLEGFKA